MITADDITINTSESLDSGERGDASPPTDEETFETINASESLATAERGVGSLPTVEEALANSDQYHSSDKNRRRARLSFILILALVIILTILVIGIVVVKNKDSSSSDSQQSTQDQQGGIDSTPTQKPAMTTPPVTREDMIKDYLATVVPNPEALEISGSPQQRAVTWMAYDDTLQYDVPDIGDTEETTFKFIQRYALVTFYYALSGENWIDDYLFLSDYDECKWKKGKIVPFQAGMVDLGAICDAITGKVVALHFYDNELHGILPPEVGLFSSLESLFLTGPYGQSFAEYEHGNFVEEDLKVISGKLPSSLQDLSHLKLFNVENNLITGTFPDWITGLANLHSLLLGYNLLQGEIPSTLGNLQELSVLRLSNNLFQGAVPASIASLTKLEHLYLDDNLDLTGDVSQIGALTSLKGLFLESNSFTGNLAFTKDLLDLYILDVSDNDFQGDIPLNLLTSNALEILDLHSNNLGPNFPDDIQDNNVLKFFSIHENNFEGAIPSSIANFKNMSHLDLSRNDFTGTIPADIGGMDKLTYLFLANNNFEPGNIPTFLKKLVNLYELSLKGTHRTGNIPDWIGDLKNLFLLDLDDNELGGSIPPSIGELSNLAFLLLNRNTLSGELPNEIQQLQYLSWLLIDDNDITGSAEGIICEGDSFANELKLVFADCGFDEFDCSCCSACCNDLPQNTVCYDEDELLAHYELIWENGYARDRYYFFDDFVIEIIYD